MSRWAIKLNLLRLRLLPHWQCLERKKTTERLKGQCYKFYMSVGLLHQNTTCLALCCHWIYFMLISVWVMVLAPPWTSTQSSGGIWLASLHRDLSFSSFLLHVSSRPPCCSVLHPRRQPPSWFNDKMTSDKMTSDKMTTGQNDYWHNNYWDKKS